MTNADIADFISRIALKAWGAGVIDNADLATALQLEAAFRNPESDAAPEALQGVEIGRNGTGAADKHGDAE